jgi:hypothetical protein
MLMRSVHASALAACRAVWYTGCWLLVIAGEFALITTKKKQDTIFVIRAWQSKPFPTQVNVNHRLFSPDGLRRGDGELRATPGSEFWACCIFGWASTEVRGDVELCL